jgi:hypothetical protein
LVY